MERLTRKRNVSIENEPFKQKIRTFELETEHSNKQRYTNRTFNILNLNQANLIPTHMV